MCTSRTRYCVQLIYVLYLSTNHVTRTIPAQAGIHLLFPVLDSGFRRSDGFSHRIFPRAQIGQFATTSPLRCIATSSKLFVAPQA